MGTITGPQMREWADTLPDSWASRKQARSAVHHWLTWMGLPLDVAKSIRVRPEPVMRSRALEIDETRLLRDAALMVGGRNGLVTLIGFYTAARASEIGGLTWKGYEDGWFESVAARPTTRCGSRCTPSWPR